MALKMNWANHMSDWPRLSLDLPAFDEMLHHALRFKIALAERTDGFVVIRFAGEDIEIHGIVELREMPTTELVSIICTTE